MFYNAHSSIHAKEAQTIHRRPALRQTQQKSAPPAAVEQLQKKA